MTEDQVIGHGLSSKIRALIEDLVQHRQKAKGIVFFIMKRDA